MNEFEKDQAAMGAMEATDAPEAAADIARQNQLLRFPGGVVDIDKPAEEAFARAVAAGQPFKGRIQPDLYLAAVEGELARFQPATGIIWHMEFASAEEFVRFRTELHEWMAKWFAPGDQR